MAFWTLGSFVFFTGLVGLVTYLLTRGDDHDSSEGYFLAGRRLTGGVIAGSLLLTNLSTEQLVGLNGAAFTNGISVMAWEVVAAVSLVLMALYFLPRFLKSGIATVPQYLEERFDHNTRTITTLIFVVAYAGILLPIVLFTGAKGLVGILDLPALTGIESPTTVLWLVVWLIGVIGSIYAIFGGLRTVAVSDTINGFGLLVGGLLITFYGLQAVAGSDGGMLDGWKTLREEHPRMFNSLGGPEQDVPFFTLFTGVLMINVFYWCTNQQIIQRTFGASSLREGQKGVLYAGTLKVLAPIILVLPGVIAFHLYGATLDDSNDAYGTLVRNVLPAPLTGFFAAVMIGAILSSFNSALNSTATLFSLGVYKTLIRPDATQQQVIRSGKWCGLVVAIAAMSSAPLLNQLDKGIFDYLQEMNAIYFIPILAVVTVGMLNRRVPAAPANLALLIGIAAIAIGYFVFPEFVKSMHKFHFVAAVFVLLVEFMLIYGAIRPRPTPYEQADSGAVEMTPWPWAAPFGLALIAAVVGLYAYFADLSVLVGTPPT